MDDIRRYGARIVRSPVGRPDVVLAASGSEVGLALDAAELLAGRGVNAAVVSVMWREKLDRTLADGTYALPDAPTVWIEAGVTVGWRALAGPRDAVVGIQRFGASGPGGEVAAQLGLTPSAIADAAMRVRA